MIFNELGYEDSEIRFETKSGLLIVKRELDLLYLDFPAHVPEPIDAPADLIEALGRTPTEVLISKSYLAVFDSEDDVLAIKPDFQSLAKIGDGSAIVTAEGRTFDFVSRFFAPGAGIDEDPVTGAAHCTLTPYWSKRLGKPVLHAQQVSERGGELFCEDGGERISIAGRAVRYLKGEIEI